MSRVRLAPGEQAQKLARVLSRVRDIGAHRAPLVVFDLDGTLMDNRPRTCAIMVDLAERWRAEHPREAELLLSMSPDRLVYLLEENLRAVGITDEALIAEAFAHWQAHFFFDHWIHHDTPLPGAAEFAHACRDAGAIIVYFTGRDLPNMALGTFASLRDSGFPIGVPGTELVLKPAPELDDTEFKRDFTPLVAQRGIVTAVFDNEPGNCNVFKEMFPDTDVFLLDTQHHPEAPPLLDSVLVIADFSGGT